MKKLLLLLLFPTIMLAQNPFNAQYGLKIQNEQKLNNATQIQVRDSITGLIGFVLKSGISSPDATTTSKGKIKLAGDLSGTADLPTVPALVTKQDILVSGTSIKTVEGQSLLGAGNIDLTKSDVGLSNVDNTSDANKPVSTATQTALNLKAPLASPTFTGTVSGITSSMVGLANVDNTSDLNKPISTATQTALNNKQPALGFTPENSANKGALNGYASLDSSGKVPTSQLPASAVTSVFARTGAVTAQSGDYTTALVPDTTDKRYQTDTQRTNNDATSSIQTQLDSKQSTLTNPVTGTGTANTFPKFTAASTVGNSNISDDGLKTTITGSTSASAGVARTALITGTTIATANNDNLTALDLSPTFNNGAFTGVKNNILRAAWNTSNFSVNDLVGAGTISFHSVSSPSPSNYFMYSTTVDLNLNSPTSIGSIYFKQAAVTKSKMMGTTGNFIIQNGGTFTDNGNMLQVTGAIRATTVVSTNGFTVATLPTGATVGTGARTYVTDALTPTFGATVVGGGAVVIPVFWNGTAWIVG